jgi:beta-phosphoglucomutase
MHQFKGYIFDMDGTMIDSMPWHLKAWEQVVRQLGSNISSENLKKELYGKNTGVLHRVFGPNRFDEATALRIGIEKEALFRQLYQGHVQPLPGLMDFLQQTKAAQIRMALGTAANRANVDFALQNLQLQHFFDAVVSEEDVQVSKPHPETFLLAAERMQVPPSQCLVFEDVPKGVEAASNAGMPCVVVSTTHPPADFAAFNNVLQIIPDFKALQKI